MNRLREYQVECIETIERQPPGAYMCVLPTGSGKTKIFTNIPRHGRVLVLAHREEIIFQTARQYDCDVGIEMAALKSNGEDVIVSSVQSIVRRLDKFGQQDFDTIICDEAHHFSSTTFRRVLDHFTPRLKLGFTASPNRNDGIRLDDVFSKIIFHRDLKWAIQSGYLSNIHCRRVYIGYDLSAVHTRMGDYAPGELEEAMDGTADAIAQAYRDYAKGPTLIFAVSVRQAEEIAARIPGAAVVTGKTADRQKIIAAFTAREIPCIVNVMVFTEGTDLPLVETVIIARPTQSDILYTQMVGRGLRVHPGKERLNLIDCVGVTGKASLCTAPSLLGVDLRTVPENKQEQLQGDLFELPQRAEILSDTPESWVMNTEIVNLWAKKQKYQTHRVAWFRLADGRMVLSLKDKRVVIPPQDDLGRVVFAGRDMGMQEALDLCYITLQTRYGEQRYLWDLALVNRWGRAPASDKQRAMVARRCKGVDVVSLTKKDASLILNRLFAGKGA